MFKTPYIVELLTPKKTANGQFDNDLMVRFKKRYQRIMEAGFGLSIPDNPMGQPRMGALESIGILSLTLDPDKVVMNLNTFHTKKELNQLLNHAADSGLKHILVVRGDGGPMLSKLDPKEIGGEQSVATSIDLIRYIHQSFSGRFVTAAPFNPYKPLSIELERMKKK